MTAPEIGAPRTRKSEFQPRVSVIIPAFNEEETIAQVVADIRDHFAEVSEVLVIDDGSTDKTAERAAAAGATVIRNPYNIGNGASVKRGCIAASGEILVMLDADGQHPASEISRLLEQIGSYDLCIGARTRRSTTSRVRNIGNAVLNSIASWISESRVVDLTSGFRAMKRTVVLQYIHLFPRRYSYPTTTTMAFLLGNHFVKYVPVDSVTRRKFGKSNLRPVHDFFRFLNIMLRLLVLFRPQKFFLPLSLITFVAGIIWATYQLFNTGGLQGTSLLLIISSVVFFCFGLLAEQIAEMRRQRSEDTVALVDLSGADKLTSSETQQRQSRPNPASK